MRQSLPLRVSQHLALTPQLQQSIRLLQLSTLELSQEVDQMLDDNPFLERAQDEAEREAYGLAQADTPVSSADRRDENAPISEAFDADPTRDLSQFDEKNSSTSDAEPLSWDGDGSVSYQADDSEWGSDTGLRQPHDADDDTASATELARSHPNLQAHLHRQALGLRLCAEDRAALSFLIESLDDDGYLQEDLTDLASQLAAGDVDLQPQVLHHFTVALGLLQSLEPAGVGARNLPECLRLQLLVQKATAPQQTGVQAQARTFDLALCICTRPMELLARRDVKSLAVQCQSNEADIKTALALIARLDPKPGRPFADVTQNIIVPDVLVLKSGSGASLRFQVRLNPEVMPRLRVHDLYANALKGQRSTASDAGVAALQQRLQEARWFIKNIQQRFDTILRVSAAIVERQKNFFVHGELAMRPLVLREIADELGLHESTISRVTTAKYMATPQGTFELKYFFGSGLGTESGGNASSTAVRALIKQFVAAENPKKPFSDNQLSDMLKEQGIECARRTVAKYREGLRIAPASLRKAL